MRITRSKVISLIKGKKMITRTTICSAVLTMKSFNVATKAEIRNQTCFRAMNQKRKIKQAQVSY